MQVYENIIMDTIDLPNGSRGDTRKWELWILSLKLYEYMACRSGNSI